MKTYDPATELRLTEAELREMQSEPADKAPVAFLEYEPDHDAAALREMSAWRLAGKGRYICLDMWWHAVHIEARNMEPKCQVWTLENHATIAEAWAALKATEGFPV